MGSRLARQIPLSGSLIPNVIDAPMFSADDQSILFSAPNEVVADVCIPSDWWSVPLAGGEPDQLTNIRAASPCSSFSSDQKHIAVYSADGIFMMKPDGSELTILLSNPDQFIGTVQWIP
jgi:hypothetical protein